MCDPNQTKAPPEQAKRLAADFTSLIANAMQSLESSLPGSKWELVSHDVAAFGDHVVLSLILRQKKS